MPRRKVRSFIATTKGGLPERLRLKSWHWQLASGTQLHERFYDASGRIVRYRLGSTIRDLSRDAADRIGAYTHYDANTAAPTPTLDQSFGYDELGRLTSVSAGGSNWLIAYDANGNRSSVTLNGTARSYTTAPTSNRLTSLSNPVRSMAHDAMGNRSSDQALYASTYNLAGRLATLTAAGTTTTYAVDGFGRRVRKFNSTGAASTVIFVYGQGGQLLGEYSNTGAALREYVWLGGTPIAVFLPNGSNPPLVYYIHADHLDAPRQVLDKSNNLRWRWMAEPFGTSAPETNPSGLGVFTFNLRFPGQYADSESGLSYNYFRDYDASTGRYVQSDPIGLAGGINTYTYVENRPTMLTDPLGLDPMSDRVADMPYGRPGDAYRNPFKNPTCMEKCIAKNGLIAGAKTATAEGVAATAASRGMVGVAYGWAWFNATFPYLIPLSAFGVYLDCQKKCEPNSCPSDEPETTFHGAP